MHCIATSCFEFRSWAEPKPKVLFGFHHTCRRKEELPCERMLHGIHPQNPPLPSSASFQLRPRRHEPPWPFRNWFSHWRYCLGPNALFLATLLLLDCLVLRYFLSLEETMTVFLMNVLFNCSHWSDNSIPKSNCWVIFWILFNILLILLIIQVLTVSSLSIVTSESFAWITGYEILAQVDF